MVGTIGLSMRIWLPCFHKLTTLKIYPMLSPAESRMHACRATTTGAQWWAPSACSRGCWG